MNTEPENARDALHVLLEEHRLLLAVLELTERQLRAIERGGEPCDRFWRAFLHFHEEFDDRIHHGKEEVRLFPALERTGLSAISGPTAVLRDEHRREHFLRERITLALAQRDRVRLLAAVAAFVDFQRSHVHKENQILFPLARRLLGLIELQRLSVEFAQLPGELDLAYWFPADSRCAPG
jgi:hemerythrin-like domain-containing protein